MANMIKIGNRWYVPQIQTTYLVMEPVFISRRLSLRGNAYCLQNQGNCDLILDNGFTLEPGQSQWFGNYNELNVMILDVMIKFLPDTNTSGDPTVQRLEVVQVMAEFSGSGYWIDQPETSVVNTAPR